MKSTPHSAIDVAVPVYRHKGVHTRFVKLIGPGVIGTTLDNNIAGR